MTVEPPEVKPGKTTNPLQNMELSQAKLVAVILAGEDTRALVEDAAGVGYIIKVGTPIGNRNGRVIAIETTSEEVTRYGRKMTIKRSQVVVEERYKVFGKPKVIKSTLKLKPIEGEKK